MAGYGVTWDGTLLSSVVPEVYVQKVSRQMVGGVRDTRIQVPGLDGDVLFEERRGNRALNAACTLVAGPSTDADRSVLETFAAWLDKTGYRKLIFSDQPDRYWEAALASDPSPDEWRGTTVFGIDWTAKPYAYSTSTSSECVTGCTDAGTESFNVPDTVDAYPIVEITARGGDMTGFTLDVNTRQLTYSGTVAQNATVTISSLSATVATGTNSDVLLTGALLSTFFPANVTGDFPVLVEGTNDFDVDWTGTATTVDVCFYWRRRYR